MVDSARSIVSDLMLAIAAVFGLFLLMVGWMVVGLTTDNGIADFGQVVRSFGLFVLTASMLVGGLLRVDMEKWVRVSMIIGTVLLITWEGFWVWW